jgi:hypothetical protein
MAVLGLLAINSLGNRRHIEEQLGKIYSRSPSILRSRSELPSFQIRGQFATEIIDVGVSSISAVTPNLYFFEQKMKEGCKLRFLLLSPESPASQVFERINKISNVKADIEQTLKCLELLIQMEQTSKGKCEVRLYLPFGLAAFDHDKETGYMNIEMYTYKITLGERPHIILTRAKDNKWFDFYRGQYEQLWDDSTSWQPLKN